MEELAYGWMSLAGVLNTHTIVRHPHQAHGTDEQQAALAAPHGHRRDPGRLLAVRARRRQRHRRRSRCKATPDGDEYVINGTKMWVTNGERAGVVALAARTPEGITCFIVEKEPGRRVRRHHRQPPPSTSSATRASRPSR